MKRAPELQMVCGHAQMAADKQKGQCTGAKRCQSWSEWHTHPMDGSQDWHTHTHTHTSPGRTTWHTHPVLEEQPGLAHTHTPSPGRIARTGTHTQDWHTHTHTQSMDGSQDWHTHTPSQSWKNSQDWHTHPGLAFAAGVYKWLRTSEKGNARLQKGALQICCGHAKMAAGKPAKTS